MAQTIILGGRLAALGGEPCLFGALGITFGPDLDEHRAQRGKVVRQMSAALRKCATEAAG
jgi:hypothetical protein